MTIDVVRDVRAGCCPPIGSPRCVFGCPASSPSGMGFSVTEQNLASGPKSIDGPPEDCSAPNGTPIGARSVRGSRQVGMVGGERFLLMYRITEVPRMDLISTC